MAIQRTRWRPDTCDCVMLVEWDNTVPEDQRTHTGAVIERACAIHAATANDPVLHHRAVHRDNRSKNVFVNAVASALGFDPVIIPYTFTAQRDLEVDTTALRALGATLLQATTARTDGLAAVIAFRLANPLGTGPVVIAGR